MRSRRAFIGSLVGAAVGYPLAARSQQRRLPLVGVLGSGSPATYDERLTLIREGLAEAGFTEGRTVAIEYRWAEGQLDRLPGLARELVGRRVDLIVATGGLQASRAAISATKTIPIVFSTDGDPVQQGLVPSLNRPSGNATGITVFSASLTAKRLDVFRALLPDATTLGVLINPAADQAAAQVQEAEQAGRSLGFAVRALPARSESEFEPALAALAGVGHAGLLVSSDPLFLTKRETLIALARRYAIPAIYGRRDFAAAGGLASYGANLDEPYRLMGRYVGRILKGEKPADLPVVQPTRFELVINLRTAASLGLQIPQAVVVRADEVLE